MQDDSSLHAGIRLPDKTGRDILYRFLQPEDDLNAVTTMLHEAYAPLAAQGMRFVVSHQDSATTRKRIDRGDTIVAVRPSHQGLGIGSTLLRLVEDRARARGVAELALDTSERALRVIELYQSKGYRFVEHVQWSATNYRSVIFAKRLE